MSSPVLVIGHQNPDNDSICAAIGYAYLRNELEKRAALQDPEYQVKQYVPVRLGAMPPESTWVCETYGFEPPRAVSHVYARVMDVMTPDPFSISSHETLLEAGKMLRQKNVRALVVVDDEGKYYGLITTRMIAERYISATDAVGEGGSDNMAVAADLITSLGQEVEELTERNVLVLDKEALLNEAIEDLMATSLREAVVLDDEDYCVGIVTRSDIATKPKRKVVLVDHNETRQAVKGIEEADVLAIIDHHRIGDVATARPIEFINLPLGSTATIVSLEFARHEVEIPSELAAVLLSAILSDTVLMKSPTTTNIDREQAELLGRLAGLEPIEFGMQVFTCRGAAEDVPLETLVAADAKEFQIGDKVALISQHETIDLASVLKREKEIRAYMRTLREKHGYEFVLLMATDIVAEGSQFFCEGNRRVVNRVFNIDCKGEGGTWMPGILSRKKQVAAKIIGA